MKDSDIIKDDNFLNDDTGFDLKASLNAAFEAEKITVSEDLIAATLARINNLKDDPEPSGRDMEQPDGEADAELPERYEKSSDKDLSGQDDDNTENRPIDISDRKMKLRSILRYAGPIAAALIIGIFGLTIIRNGRMTKKAEMANSTQNFADAVTGNNKSASEKTAGEGLAYSESMKSEEAAEYAPEAFMDENLYLDNVETNENTDMKSEIKSEAPRGTDTSEIPESGNITADVYGKMSASGTDGTAKESSDGEDTEEDADWDRSTEYRYFFPIPDESAQKVSETVSEYISDAGDKTVRTGKYLVITDEYFFFTDDETLMAEDGEPLYPLNASEGAADELAAAVDEILNR